jgi:hypothetical protein
MPKLPAYPHLDGLFDLACRDGVDIRPTLLRVLTDLYVQKPMHSAEEEAQYVALALGLIDTVDPGTRATVAARLARYDAAPEAVLRRLGVQAAVPPAPVKPAAPAEPAMAPDELANLFFSAGRDERRLILANLEFADSQTAPAPASPHLIERLEAAALAHNAAEFTRLLALALRLSHDFASRIVRDPSGEPIVVAAKAIGMKAAVLQRILLCLDPAIAQSVARVYDLADLYDEITFATAARMLAIWRDSGGSRRPVHAPQLYDDALRNLRARMGGNRQRRAQPQAPAAARSGTR